MESELRHRGPSDTPAYDAPEEERPETPRPASGGSNPGFWYGVVQRHLPILIKILFVLERLIDTLITIGGRIRRLYRIFLKRHEEFNPVAVVGMFTGFVCAFFGGWFVVTVAMVSAFNQGGSDRLFAAVKDLQEQVDAVREASAADDQVDEDGDGIADVLQISKEELAKRKLYVALGAMDPSVVQDAAGALWTSTLSAAATVKLQFARTVALGISIGDYVNKPVQRFVVPALKQITPKEYHKWYPSVFGYVCRMFGATIAFQIQRVLSTVSTAVRGGNMMIENFADFCHTRNLTFLSEGVLDDIAAWILVAIGIYFQIFVIFKAPFLLRVVLFPFFFLEWLLTTLVTTV